MPIIEVKAFEHRFEDEAENAKIGSRFTEVVRETFGDDAAAETWVILEGVAPKCWGFGGSLRT